MYYLYADNFRGFSDTLIPISDVNFLVGENSTGKTSILGLIDFFSDHNYLMNQNLDTKEVKFGHFSDIVSIHSENKSYFTIGMISEMNTKTGKKKINDVAHAVLMTYKEKNGLPYLYRYTVLDDKQVTMVKRQKSAVLFKQNKSQHAYKSTAFYKSTYRAWIKSHNGSEAGFRTLNIPKFFSNITDVPMALVLSLIDEKMIVENKSKDTDEDNLTFSISSQTPMLGRNLIWIAPIRTTPKRTYDEVQLNFTPDGCHTPYVIKKILDSRTQSERFIKRINKIGKSSGLFQSISTKNYGKGPTAPFELDILVDNKALNISLVGYGVSQSLPVIVELLNRPSGSWYAVQQPEVHLHPRAQASLGDLFFELAVVEDKKFLVETHSDYTIDRFRINYMNSKRKKPNAHILFFERKNKRNSVTSIEISKDGALSAKQPKKYRDFFVKEEMKLLGI